MKRYDVYISYSRHDKKIAEEIKNALTEKGFSSFIDTEELSSGSDYAACILNAIEQAEIFLCIYSINSVDSQWQRHEIDFAFSLYKENASLKILPVIIGEAKMHLPYAFKEIHYIDDNAAVSV